MLSAEDQVIRAETLQALDCVHSNHSFASANNDNEKFKKMSPFVLGWAEHEDPNKQYEPAKHLKHFPGHQFQWKEPIRAPEYMRKKKHFRSAFNQIYQSVS